MISLTNEIIIPQVAEKIKAGYTVTLPLRGYSMRPYLEDGRDKALLAAVDTDLQIGDVILAEISERRWALHRITAIDGDNITMCGDGNFTSEHIKRADVIAIAKGFYRKGRDILEETSTISYAIYWKTWLFLRPIRRYLLFAWKLWKYPIQTLKHLKGKILNDKAK
jgi:hypothetical protein